MRQTLTSFPSRVASGYAPSKACGDLRRSRGRIFEFVSGSQVGARCVRRIFEFVSGSHVRGSGGHCAYANWGGGEGVSSFSAGVLQAGRPGARKGGRVVLLFSGGGSAGPGEPSDWFGAWSLSKALVPCFPLSIDVCLAVWEQFWCDRAGLVCGSLAFHRARRRLVRRGSPRGKTYAYPEGHPRWLPASKRVNPFWIRASKAAVLRLGFVSRGRPLVPFRLVKSGRDQKWDAARLCG